jgi:hypothetical protein
MSFFQKLKIDLKKQYIITSSASALPISRALPLCFGMFGWTPHHPYHYAVVLKTGEKYAKDGPKSSEAVLPNSWFDIFRGCFE